MTHICIKFTASVSPFTLEGVQRIQTQSKMRPSFLSILTILFVCFGSIILTWYSLVRSVNPHCPEQHTSIVVGKNKAQLSEKFSNELELDIRDSGKFHVVTNFILFTHRAYSANLRYDENLVPTDNQLIDRQKEVEKTLQINLNNELIAAVHVLFYHPAILVHLMELNLKNSQKLVLHLTRRDPTVGINLDYINNYLFGKYVILLHQDNFLGEGWNTIDFDEIRSQRVMYALTRHAISNQMGCNAALSANCNPGAMYIGSHDTFAFFMDKKFPMEMLKDLDILPSALGMENVLIYYFRNNLSYKVLNPCLVLKVYHSHCVPVRQKDRKRYNLKGKNGLAPFTNRLV